MDFILSYMVRVWLNIRKVSSKPLYLDNIRVLKKAQTFFYFINI